MLRAGGGSNCGKDVDDARFRCPDKDLQTSLETSNTATKSPFRGHISVTRTRYGGFMQEVEVRRSRRRRKSVQAYREDGKTIVLIPAHFTRAQEKRYVESMIAQLDQREQRRRPSDEELMVRAAELNDRFLGGVAVPQSIRWVTNQNSRWGSCTVGEGTIRLSHRLQGMPDWVVDYVIIHELAHLLHSNHGAGFWALVNRYPKTERARGFLEGVSHKR